MSAEGVQPMLTELRLSITTPGLIKTCEGIKVVSKVLFHFLESSSEETRMESWWHR